VSLERCSDVLICPPNRAGQKAGYLGSAFFFGNFIGSFGWGWASDVFGRKPIMLLGLFFTLIMELLFGFSQNFAWAVTARFLWGLLNGNLGVAKTYISEVCDDSNQAKGFSVIGTSSGIGRLVGSVVGGFLSQPASKYSAFETQFFCKFPYALPCIVGATICLFSFVAASIFIEETLHKTRRDSAASSETTETPSSTDSGIELARQLLDDERESGDRPIASDTAPLVMESDIDSESDGGMTSFDERVGSDTELLINEGRSEEEREMVGIVRRWSTSWSPHVAIRRTRSKARGWREGCGVCVASCASCTPKKARRFLRDNLRRMLGKLHMVARLMVDRKVFLSTSIYGMYGGLHVLVSETFPLLMVTCYRHGGYHLDGSELGVIIMCSGVLQIFWQLLVYPRLVELLGYRRTFQFGVFACVACFMILPFSNRITGPIGDAAYNLCSGSQTNSTSASSSVYSGSGSGGFAANSTGFCRVDYETNVNENSVLRIPARVWAMLLTVMALLVISRISGFISLFVLVGNSSLPETRGSVNGIGQSLVAISRSIAPLVGSLLFAWSENNGYSWPLDYHFVFNTVALLAVALIFISLLLPKSIEKKRERPTVAKQQTNS
jgi:MFS family permease